MPADSGEAVRRYLRDLRRRGDSVPRGEPVGRVTSAYDSEKLVDGVYAVTCEGCRQRPWAAVSARAATRPAAWPARSPAEQWPIPAACAEPGCGCEELRYLALLPARVSFQRNAPTRRGARSSRTTSASTASAPSAALTTVRGRSDRQRPVVRSRPVRSASVRAEADRRSQSGAPITYDRRRCSPAPSVGGQRCLAGPPALYLPVPAPRWGRYGSRYVRPTRSSRSTRRSTTTAGLRFNRPNRRACSPARE